MSNQKILIEKLESLAEFDGRYTQLQCVNFDSTSGEKRGCFSLVFKAFDSLENKHVAIKFYDPNPTAMSNHYRVKAFEREPEILVSLQNRARCLQLVSGLKTYSLEIAVGQGQIFQLPCKYFVMEWIEDQIDDFFENQESIDAIAKLKLFHEIALGVVALHRHDVHHRDIKVDNLRLKRIGKQSEAIVAIDLGTSARSQDPNLLTDYKKHVGAPAYAAPEMTIGFAGHRDLGHLTDFYSLGCLLFELFNKELFYTAVRLHSPKYDTVMAALVFDLQACKSNEERVFRWQGNMDTFKHIVESPPIDGAGSSAPIAIAAELNKLIFRLTHFDFSERTSEIEEISTAILACIRILENHALTKHRKELKLKWRKNRIEKIQRRVARYGGVALPGVKNVE